VLIRQKAALALLQQANKQLSPTVFVKLMFLLRQETAVSEEKTFYDFVPYKFGPFSFALYRELGSLRRNGYLMPHESSVALADQSVHLIQKKIRELPGTLRTAIKQVISRHGLKSQSSLLRDVYARYPWYATKSELTHLRPPSDSSPPPARPAVYTIGYEAKSVDVFFNQLLRKGIEAIIDVRANPISRCYGFSKSQLSDIGRRLGFDYRHMPNLGIPSRYRSNLSDFDSYQLLLRRYAFEMLPHCEGEMGIAGEFMLKTAAVLMCFEKDVLCCHRGPLAQEIAKKTGLEVVHL